MPKVTVSLPIALRKCTGGAIEVEADVSTVAELLADLERQYPNLRERIYDEDDPTQLSPQFVIFVGDNDIRWDKGVFTPLNANDHVLIQSCMGGGN